MLLNDIDAPACLETLCAMVRARSVSATPGEADLARDLLATMDRLGLETELQAIGDGRFNAIGRWRGTGGGKCLLLNGHIDTNPLTLGWTVDPWGGVRDERFVFGLGCSNMKAGASAYLCAVRELIERNVRLAGDVVISFVCGELQGGVGTLKLIDKGLKADCFIVGEPTDLAAVTLHAGTVDFEIDLIGETRHMSKREDAGDAAAAAAALTLRLNAFRPSDPASAEHAAVTRTHVGTVRAALTPAFDESRRVQVADFARLAGTCRHAPSQARESILPAVKRLADTVCAETGKVRAEIREPLRSGLQPMRPFEVKRTAAIVRSFNARYHDLTGEPQRTGAIPPACFFNSDASHLQNVAGIADGIVCGPGGRYNTMPDERVDIVDYLLAVKLYASVIVDLCGSAAPALVVDPHRTTA